MEGPENGDVGADDREDGYKISAAELMSVSPVPNRRLGFWLAVIGTVLAGLMGACFGWLIGIGFGAGTTGIFVGAVLSLAVYWLLRLVWMHHRPG